MFKRRKIGSVNTLSPAQKIRGWMVSLASKIIFATIVSIALYFLFQYVIYGIINFLSDKVLQAGPIDKNNKTLMISMIVVIILADIYILKDRLSKRK